MPVSTHPTHGGYRYSKTKSKSKVNVKKGGYKARKTAKRSNRRSRRS